MRWIKAAKSSLRTSTTEASNLSCLVRVPEACAASWKARPKRLKTGRRHYISIHLCPHNR
jgi:hypothetical protein